MIMVPSFLYNKTSRYSRLILSPYQRLSFFARNQTYFLTTRSLWLERRYFDPIHTSFLQNLRNLILSRFSIPKHGFQAIRLCTGSNGLKSTVSYVISDLSQDTYHRLSEITMEHLSEYLENLGEQINIDGYDVEYSSGVLTFKCPSGTYVLNKQPPNKQIWLSSPISGPKRYDYDSKHQKWFYHRDNSTLDGLLNEELSTIFRTKIDVSLSASAGS